MEIFVLGVAQELVYRETFMPLAFVAPLGHRGEEGGNISKRLLTEDYACPTCNNLEQ